MRYDDLKQKLKNRFILNIYSNFFKFLFSLDPVLPMSIPIKLYYLISTGKKLDLKNPKLFNEKIQWLKVYYRNPLYVKCADKYSVREYVSSQSYSEILNELYGVYDNIDDVNFNELPNKFVLKATHGCATNIICDDKSKLDIPLTKKKVSKWMKQTTGLSTGEMHYKYIKPRIIIERYIGNDDGTLPIDYKIFCFNGKPKFVCVYSDRDRETLSTKRAFFVFNWEPLNITTKAFYTDRSRATTG